MMVALPQQQLNPDTLARVYLLALQRGEAPTRPPTEQLGRWSRLCDILDIVRGDGEAVQRAVRTLIAAQKFPGLADLLAPAPSPSVSPGLDRPQLYVVPQPNMCPPLPEGIAFPAEVADGASPLLDLYIQYSKQFSPEGFEDFHEAVFLWLLSVIAARRIYIPFAQRVYPSLMIALVARTTAYAKSSTAKAAIAVLQACGLRWMLGPDETTPQKLLSDMVGTVPVNYDECEWEKQEQIRQRLKLCGQRGWYYDEFGELIKALTRQNDVMAGFKGLLLKLDGSPDAYEYATLKRGTESIEKPYLALLGCTTPPSMRATGKAGSELWSDGFHARMAYVCPPEESMLDAPFSFGDVPVPDTLRQALTTWHQQLGMPDISISAIVDGKDRPTGRYNVTKSDLPETPCHLGEGVADAWRRYRSALKQLLLSNHNQDLDGSYSRLPVKALRVAALLASLENDNRIELRHWAKAQEIAERWRLSLHELYGQINTMSATPTPAATLESEVLRHMQRLTDKGKTTFTATELSAWIKSHARGEIEEVLKTLAKLGVASREVTSRTTKYSLTDQQPSTTTGQTAAEADW